MRTLTAAVLIAALLSACTTPSMYTQTFDFKEYQVALTLQGRAYECFLTDGALKNKALREIVWVA